METILKYIQNPIIFVSITILITIIIISITPLLKKAKFKKVKLPGGIELEMDGADTKTKATLTDSDIKLLTLKYNDVKRLLETCINDTIEKCEKKSEILKKLQEKKEEIIENVLNNIKPKIKLAYNKKITGESHSQLIFFLFSKTIEYNFSNILLPTISKTINEKHLENMSSDDLTDLYKDIIKKTESCLSKISEEYIEANVNSLIDIDKIDKSLEEYSDLIKSSMKDFLQEAQEYSIGYAKKIESVEETFKQDISKNIQDFVKEDIKDIDLK